MPQRVDRAEDTPLIELLTLISDFNAQREYEKRVSIASVPAELVCMWFDDLYRPDAAWFRRTYSDAQRTILAEFHAYYEARVDALPSDSLSTLQRSTAWRDIAEKAADVLERLKSAR